MLSFVTGPFLRTKGRFTRLYASFREQYLKLSDFYELEGFSLRPRNVFMRAVKVATFLTCFLIFVTVPVIFYYRGLEDPYVYLEMAKDMGFAWVSALIVMLLSFFMWTATAVAGKTFAESELFLGFVEKRWSKRIEEITRDFLSKKYVCALDTIPEDKAEANADEYECFTITTNAPNQECNEISVVDLDGKGTEESKVAECIKAINNASNTIDCDKRPDSMGKSVHSSERGTGVKPDDEIKPSVKCITRDTDLNANYGEMPMKE